jgi:hypothetical protein
VNSRLPQQNAIKVPLWGIEGASKKEAIISDGLFKSINEKVF